MGRKAKPDDLRALHAAIAIEEARRIVQAPAPLLLTHQPLLGDDTCPCSSCKH